MAVESPDSDPNFYISYGLFFPTYILGFILNLWVLITMVTYQRRLLNDRLSYCLASMLLSCLYWSSMSVARYTIIPFVDYKANFLAQFFAAGGSIAMLSILGANLCLAMERYFMIRQGSIQGTKKFFFIAIGVLSFLACVSTGIFTTSPASNTIVPDRSPQFEIWLGIMTSTFLVAVFIVVYLYASTYYFAARTLKNLPPDYDVVRLTMQRKLMMYCTLMSSSLLVCYIPIVIYLMVPKTVQENPWMTAISGEFVAMDNIINPVLILYFVPRIRNAVIGKLEEEKEDYGEWELQDQ